MEINNQLRKIAENKLLDHNVDRSIRELCNNIYFSDPHSFVQAIKDNIKSRHFHKQNKNTSLRILLAHQAVMFPYEAITINYLLMDSISKNCSKQGKISVEPYHIVLDMDISKERRFRNVSVPRPLRKHGIVKIVTRINRSKRYMPMALMDNEYDYLLEQLRKLKDDLLFEINVIGKLGIHNQYTPKYFEYVYRKIVDCVNNKNLYKLNLCTSTVLANDILLTTTKFRPFSKLLNSTPELKDKLTNGIEKLAPYAIELTDTYNKLGIDIPKSLGNFVNRRYFWGICCNCFSRNHLIGISGYFKCYYCKNTNSVKFGNYYETIDGFNCPQIIPKVILEEYLLLYEFGYSAFVTYSGGAEHVITSNILYNMAGLDTIPTLIWRPHTDFISPSIILADEIGHQKLVKYTNHHKIFNALNLHYSGRASWLYPLMYMSNKDYINYWEQYFLHHIWNNAYA